MSKGKRNPSKTLFFNKERGKNMRMKNWKRFAAVAMSVMCMGTMVACGSSGSASNDSKTGSAGSSSKSQTNTVV